MLKRDSLASFGLGLIIFDFLYDQRLLYLRLNAVITGVVIALCIAIPFVLAFANTIAFFWSMLLAPIIALWALWGYPKTPLSEVEFLILPIGVLFQMGWMAARSIPSN